MRQRVGRPAGNASRIRRERPVMSLVAAIVAATLLLSTAAAAQVAEVTRQIEVAATVPTVVGRPQTLSPDCEHTVPEVTIVEAPAGGAVAVQPARYPMGDVAVGRVAGNEDKPDCDAAEVDGVEVVYTPRDGTRQDRLVLQMTYQLGGGEPDQVILLTLDIEVAQ